MFHQPVPHIFTNIAEALQRNQRDTVTTGDILDRAGSLTTERSVWLTFDDGWSSVWSVAFPIAKRYGLQFTVFICPELIEESDECRTTIESGLEPNEAMQRDLGQRARLTWGELKQMSQSGLVDVQSHSLHHGLVFWSPGSQISPQDVDLALRGGSPILQRSGMRGT
jgi:peptidoglycan/xylan/chitin deacetylase (PgdA/CDA1 family)